MFLIIIIFQQRKTESWNSWCGVWNGASAMQPNEYSIVSVLGDRGSKAFASNGCSQIGFAQSTNSSWCFTKNFHYWCCHQRKYCKHLQKQSKFHKITNPLTSIIYLIYISSGGTYIYSVNFIIRYLGSIGHIWRCCYKWCSFGLTTNLCWINEVFHSPRIRKG